MTLINQHIISDIKTIVSNAQEKAIRSVNFERTLMYWHIGQRIFEEEQQGRERAEYGSYLLKYLSDQLQPEFGSGFSIRQLELMRQFYKVFPIASTLYSQLSWSQYKLLLRIEDSHKREYYIAETAKNNWTVRQLERQINSQLYGRLLVSNDKESILAVAKTEKLAHQHLGQLQMYVNYYDRVEKLPHENPTIGILLCADKNDAVVKFTLPSDEKNIVASQYQLYLPSENQLLAELQKELQNFTDKSGGPIS